MAEPQRVGGYPKHDEGSFPLLVIFDDSLHNRWSVPPEGLQPEFDDAMDVGRLRGGHRVPCGKSIRATFKHSVHMLMLRASEPMVVSNATAPLLLSLAFTLAAGASSGRPCEPKPVRGRCDSTACVSLRLQGTRFADTLFVPLCGNRQGPALSAGEKQIPSHPNPTLTLALALNRPLTLAGEKQPRWQQMELPLEHFGHRGQLDELVVVPGTPALRQNLVLLLLPPLHHLSTTFPPPLHHSPRPCHDLTTALPSLGAALRLELPLTVHLDEVWLSAARPPLAGDSPPSYGRSDINEVQGGWLQGVARRGAASAGKSNKNPHFCEYMSSELAHSKGKDSKGKEKRPLCRMDGDHLRGRWMQTCDPRLIQRPDHFAYKRALPAMEGWCGCRLTGQPCTPHACSTCLQHMPAAHACSACLQRTAHALAVVSSK